MYKDGTINDKTELHNDFDIYAIDAQKTALYPSEKALEYLALGLSGEAGEIANKVKKILRGDYENKGALQWDIVRADLLGECGDVLWYLSQLVLVLDGRLSEVASENIAKLRRRYTEGTIKGTGDKR